MMQTALGYDTHAEQEGILVAKRELSRLRHEYADVLMYIAARAERKRLEQEVADLRGKLQHFGVVVDL